jgi:hypothetical protein
MREVSTHPEQAFFQAFVVPQKRERYAELLNTKRGREKIRRSLDHFGDLDLRFCQKPAPSEQHAGAIVKTLRSLGAPDACYVMSSWNNMDGRQMNLVEAVNEAVGCGMGCAISCIPGVLGYFESEEVGERYVCYRKAGS